ncbi:MAG: hypothetical protein KGK01_07410 [Bradyrhizobium sp.]|uniref:hypothetical protein n=1 Tax=Bradyrhizobium sp. TaxID=376 RepID=UPI001C28DA76|nr:hypothetical protein [Bradyrhizobium sp.]MBU6461278.1 hypothetical protein [Pseudomonadota bacterium]MDE2065759.1 hypothetical protein [Bradyrhizobium sp.]MDE2242264.1 hypothetical protein [Bradyrhizobium sp.]
MVSIARRVWFPKSPGARIASAFALLCIAPLLFYATRFLIDKAWSVEVTFQGMSDDVSRFAVYNGNRSKQFVRVTRFVLSTARFGKLDWDDFDSKIADPGRFVPAAGRIDFSVVAPADTGEYLCSSLRAIGFFAQYGALKNGRLTAGPARASTAKKIIEDLSCSYDFSNKKQPMESVSQKDDGSDVTQTIHVPCGQVGWVSECVSQIAPF